MKRKLYIGSFGNSHIVFEQVRGGARAVSKSFSTKTEAEAALQALKVSI
jgi:hypothetical protein